MLLLFSILSMNLEDEAEREINTAARLTVVVSGAVMTNEAEIGGDESTMELFFNVSSLTNWKFANSKARSRDRK